VIVGFFSSFVGDHSRMDAAFHWLCNGPEFESSEPAPAVYVERVSATEFPANREINRENHKSEPLGGEESLV
jgi:hypothetical protein